MSYGAPPSQGGYDARESQRGQSDSDRQIQPLENTLEQVLEQLQIAYTTACEINPPQLTKSDPLGQGLTAPHVQPTGALLLAATCRSLAFEVRAQLQALRQSIGRL